MTHAEFVQMVKSKQITFEVMIRNKYRVLSRAQKRLFQFCVFLYTIVPLVAIPIIAYQFGNWYLLAGLPVSILASVLSPKGVLFILAYTVCCVFGWLKTGFHFSDAFTFYAASAWWGFTWFAIADAAKENYFKRAVLKKPHMFEAYAEQNLIRIADKS